MSLMGTLAKVAVGVAVAKGVGSMMKKSGGSGGGILGNAPADGRTGGSGGGDLGDLLGQVLGGGQAQTGGTTGRSGGGLGDLMKQLGGDQNQIDNAGAAPGQGGLGDLLGQLTGGQGGAGGGGLGGLLGGLLGGASQTGSGGSFGDMLNDALQNRGEPKAQPSAQQEAAAALMLRAMIQAVKCDGEMDANERKKLMANLKDATPQEQAFVEHEFQQPVDVEALARQVPRGLEQQVYMMSVMAIDLDKQAEAQYLHSLATAMGVSQQQVNAIHDHIGVQRLYA